jgi:hypothetical protein
MCVQRSTISLTCEWCGQFVTVPYRKPEHRRFCTRTCANYAMWSVRSPEAGKRFTCEECGVVTVAKGLAQARRQRFCSYSCSNRATGRLHPAAPDVTYTCEWCGATGTARPNKKPSPRFCNRSCAAKAKMAQRDHTPNRNATTTRGYRYLYQPDHPGANTYGYVAEHRLVAEGMLGRPLRSDEIVHHRNEQPGDNRPENLQVMTRREHAQHHNSLPPGSWSRKYAACIKCGRTDHSHSSRGLCMHCRFGDVPSRR